MLARGSERNASLCSSNSTFYVNLVEEVPQDVFIVRTEYLDHSVLEEEDEDLLLEDETDCGDTLSELSCSLSQQLDGYGTDTSYEKACGSDRRGSAPATPILGARPADSTPNRLVNFFSKRSFKSNPLKRTKSVTKLERTKRGGRGGVGGLLEPDPLSLGSTARLRSSRSHESLLSSHNMMNTLDLAAGEVTIKPLHASILGQEHCFQVTSPTGIRYFSCRTADERDRWVDSLRKAVNPNFDSIRRTENSLKIFILEAKGVGNKKRYFCELLLDASLFARTSSKQKSEMCFWGEQFEFNNLPSVENISVALYREGEKKRKKEKNLLVGTVNIPVANVTSRCHIEKWYQVQNDNRAPSKDNAALRIKCKFQSIDILPIELYTDFLQYVKTNYGVICELLEPVISVKAKEDIATALIHIMQREGIARNFLSDLVMMEIDRIDDSHLLFRGNSLATKSMEAFMKLVGGKYLLDTLRQVINKVVEAGLDCEVDPMKVPQISVQKQQENLLSIVRMTWSRILNSHPYFPLELRECFCMYRERLASIGKQNLSDNLISASIFLRFLCPAILSPSLFNITQEYPDERSSRNLTLIAKTLQTLANFTKFQGKENFMEFMNEFIELEQAQMKSFLKQISSPASHDHRALEYDKDIDTGKELSLLHTFLTEALVKLSTSTSRTTVSVSQQRYLDKLSQILGEISVAQTQPNINIVQRLSSHSTSETPSSDPTSPPESGRMEDRLGYQSLQRNIFRYNDPTVSEDYKPVVPPPINHLQPPPPDTPSTPRPSTLPRNTYLMGSARKPAVDLNTADDYVLFSALEPDGRPREAHPIGHSYSYSHLAPGPALNASSPVHSHHHHFHNHTAWFNNRQVFNGHPQMNGHGQIHQNGHMVSNGNPEEPLDMSHEENDRNSTGETETNMKGSQTSISQLSNVASSGYQSFAYSQSSSPVDPSITHHDAANNNAAINSSGSSNNSGGMHVSPHMTPPQLAAPLAFNNPMYHLNAATSSPRPVPQCGARIAHHHHHLHQNLQLQQSPVSSSLSSAHSVEDLPTAPTIAPSLPSTCGPQRTHSSSSEDSTSLACTPPLEHRAFKSGAPRTNPRCVRPGWSQPAVAPSTAPDHHHSTSDLLGGGAQCRRTKMSRRQSAEVGNGRRQRYPYDSDSSSDEQQPPPARLRPPRTNHRTSETKTLDEAHPSGPETSSEGVPSALAHDSRAHHHSANLSSSPVQPSAHQHNRHNHHSPQYPPPQQVMDTEAQGAQMRELLQKLQEQFRKEQMKMSELMSEKDAVIQRQEDRINALDRTNTQLLMALEQIRELKLREQINSQLGPQEVSQLSDTSDYKSSSC
ncbi:ras GTPase-activating protein nGAP-like isoform X2 [Homarus americanus]|uniref:ras GTPase-activating protein nGAP-like isoform X2 n=1 Tax=Homarus americanus TaxID=6706 RepID=UPI001C443C7B|nr:ras GTPase-activating protein nGAP-like isoform X2 [Homarus americanus]